MNMEGDYGRWKPGICNQEGTIRLLLCAAVVAYGSLSGLPTIRELDFLLDDGSCDLQFGFARTRSAEFLSDALKDFVRESRIQHGASQNNATDQRGCLKDGLIPVPPVTERMSLSPVQTRP